MLQKEQYMRIMKLLSLPLFLMLTACGGSDDTPTETTNPSNPIIGTYFFAGTLENNDFYYLSVEIKEGTEIQVVDMIFPESNPSKIYARRKSGNYVVDGNKFDVTWYYETCEPEGTFSFTYSSEDPSDRIFATYENKTLQFLNTKKWIPEQDYTSTALTITEDIECNLFPNADQTQTNN